MIAIIMTTAIIPTITEPIVPPVLLTQSITLHIINSGVWGFGSSEVVILTLDVQWIVVCFENSRKNANWLTIQRDGHISILW
jgi:hypothetical protein